MRYHHYLTPLLQDRWPTRLAVVGVAAAVSSNGVAGGRLTARLLRWSAKCYRLKEHTYKATCYHTGTAPDQFWDSLSQQAEQPGSIHIVCCNATQVWSLLRLWEKLENGAIVLESGLLPLGQDGITPMPDMRSTVPGTEPPRTNSRLHRLPNQWQGMVIAEDPPNIAQFRFLDKPATITWWDCRNWGVTIAECDLQPDGGLSHVANWCEDMIRLCAVHQLGHLLPTPGGQAMQSWRLSYYQKGIYCHAHPMVSQLEEQSYHGGRCECYQLGERYGDFYYLDVRSMYPWICSTMLLPVRLRSYCQKPHVGILSDESVSQAAIATVLVYTDVPIYPVRRSNLTIYPVGCFRTTLAGPELTMAYRNNHICEIDEMAVYDREPMLMDWAADVYQMRNTAEAQGNQYVAKAIKSLLVSLPGKLAQRYRPWERVPSQDGEIYWGDWYGTLSTGEIVRYRSIAGIVYRQRNMGWARESIPSAASFITSAGRIRLWGILSVAGIDNTLYADTDGIIVDRCGYDRLHAAGQLVERMLGALSVRQHSTYARIVGVKHYLMDNKRICAGQSKGYTVDCGDGRTYHYLPSASEQIHYNNRPSGVQYERHYVESAPYRHGVVDEMGKVIPLHLWEV